MPSTYITRLQGQLEIALDTELSYEERRYAAERLRDNMQGVLNMCDALISNPDDAWLYDGEPV